MAGLTYLFRQDGRFYFRRRVPRDLGSLIQKSEIKISLGSCSLRDAKNRVVYLTAIHQDLFNKVRKMAKYKDLIKDNTDLKKAVDDLMDENDRLRQAHADHSTGMAEMFQTHLEHNRGIEKQVNEHLDGVYEAHKHDKETAIATAKDEQKDANTDAILDRLDGMGSSVQKTKALPTIIAFLPDYVAEKSKKWSESAKRHNLNAIDLFIKIMGDQSLSDFTRKDIRNYMDKMELVHKSYGKSDKDKDRTIDEILAIAANKEKMTVTTLEKHLKSVKALFRTANWHYDSVLKMKNLFEDMEFSDDVRQADKRIPWAVADLNKLFATPQWTGTSKTKRSLRYNEGNKIIKDAYWWLPVIAIYTGMRLEEICQLQCGDLKSEGDIQYLDLEAGAGKRLKTASSARQVPIHAVLIDLGFLTLFQGKKPTDRIFPELTRGGVDQKLGYDYSADFATYRRKTGTYEEWKDYHSFRHTFVSAMMKLTNGNAVLTGSIVGHGSASQTEDYTHIQLDAKSEVMALLEYNGLDLAHLKKP